MLVHFYIEVDIKPDLLTRKRTCCRSVKTTTWIANTGATLVNVK